MEVDILRSRDHDMLEDAGVYSGLLVAALENKIKAVITGPNCRTRSVLRHRHFLEEEVHALFVLGETVKSLGSLA